MKTTTDVLLKDFVVAQLLKYWSNIYSSTSSTSLIYLAFTLIWGMTFICIILVLK